MHPFGTVHNGRYFIIPQKLLPIYRRFIFLEYFFKLFLIFLYFIQVHIYEARNWNPENNIPFKLIQFIRNECELFFLVHLLFIYHLSLRFDLSVILLNCFNILRNFRLIKSHFPLIKIYINFPLLYFFLNLPFIILLVLYIF